MFGGNMIYKIAGIYVEMDPQYPRTAEQSMVYRVTEPAKPDLKLRTDKKIMDKLKEIHSLPNDESSEYMLLATEFYEYRIEFGGFMLHSSAVVHNGKAHRQHFFRFEQMMQISTRIPAAHRAIALFINRPRISCIFCIL